MNSFLVFLNILLFDAKNAVLESSINYGMNCIAKGLNKTGATLPIDSQKVDNRGNASPKAILSSLFKILLTISSIFSNPPSRPKLLIKLISKSDLHLVL